MQQFSYDRLLSLRIACLLCVAWVFGTPALAGPDADLSAASATAPDFELRDQDGKWHRLSNYCGQWVVLYFYPKDDTPGCTTEACEFRDDIYTFRKNNIKVIGISLDDVESHKDFADKYSLPFTLLSDADRNVAEMYGVLKNYGVIKYTARETFLIDPAGKVAKHYKKVEPKGHAAEVLASIRDLSAPTVE